MDSWARRVHTGMADRVSVASSAPPRSNLSDRMTLAWIAIVFVVVSLAAKFVGGGVAVLIFGAPYVLACGIHLWIHRRALTRLALDWIDLGMIFSSHFALLCGFLLQEDGVINGPAPFVTVSKLLQGDSVKGLPDWFWFNAWAPFVGIPVAVSWLALLVLSTRRGVRAGLKLAGAVVVGLLALALVMAVVAVVLTT